MKIDRLDCEIMDCTLNALDECSERASKWLWRIVLLLVRKWLNGVPGELQLQSIILESKDWRVDVQKFMETKYKRTIELE